MKNVTIPKSSIEFIKKVSKNNSREWFNAHKDTYLEEYQHMIDFAGALWQKMSAHDHIETETGKQVLFRIYADTRFSKDKKPYKTHWAGRFKRATKKLRGGYYFHIEPGNKSYVAGGFWGPNAADMKRIREDIDVNYDEWRKVLSAKPFVKTFGALEGEQLTTAPKGYEKDHPAIDLLRYKQYVIRYRFSDEEILAPGFVTKANDTFKAMRPFLNHMSEILTTDANGVLIV
jgi:uncharacterized protein (TIGR02453 family)